MLLLALVACMRGPMVAAPAGPPQPPVTSTLIFWLILLGAICVVSLVGYLLRNQAKAYYNRARAHEDANDFGAAGRLVTVVPATSAFRRDSRRNGGVVRSAWNPTKKGYSLVPQQIVHPRAAN